MTSPYPAEVSAGGQPLRVAAEEPICFQRHRRRTDVDMDITPMIDITFLLLIFFLVATRMSPESQVPLPAARYGKAVSTKDAAVLTVTAREGGRAVIYQGETTAASRRLQADDPVDQQDEIVRYLRQQMDRNGKRHVVIKAEPGVKHRDVARLARAVGAASDCPLFVAVMEKL
jgi:biopolymer transport protein ExbD